MLKALQLRANLDVKLFRKSQEFAFITARLPSTATQVKWHTIGDSITPDTDDALKIGYLHFDI